MERDKERSGSVSPSDRSLIGCSNTVNAERQTLKNLIGDRPWVLRCIFDFDSETWLVQVWDMKCYCAVVSNSGGAVLLESVQKLNRALADELRS